MNASNTVSENLVERILSLPQKGRRRLIAVAGAPASGKSTIAASLTEALRAAGKHAENIPMDGFHLDNRILEARGLLSRKGAPETFDAAGFVAMITRLAEGEEVYYPLFERSQEQAIAGAGYVDSDCDYVVVEGNYLLFDADPWRELAVYWDLSIWFELSEDVILERCIQRWLDHGYTREAALGKAEGNDLRNARLINASRVPADVVLGAE